MWILKWELYDGFKLSWNAVSNNLKLSKSLKYQIGKELKTISQSSVKNIFLILTYFFLFQNCPNQDIKGDRISVCLAFVVKGIYL